MQSLFIDFLIDNEVYEDWCKKTDKDTDAFLERVHPRRWFLAAFIWNPEQTKWSQLDVKWQMEVTKHIKTTRFDKLKD